MYIYIYIYIYIYTHTHIVFQILFSYSLLQNIEYSSLCYTVGSCWLSLIYRSVCKSIPSLNLHVFLVLNNYSGLYMCVTLDCNFASAFVFANNFYNMSKIH